MVPLVSVEVILVLGGKVLGTMSVKQSRILLGSWPAGASYDDLRTSYERLQIDDLWGKKCWNVRYSPKKWLLDRTFHELLQGICIHALRFIYLDELLMENEEKPHTVN